MSGTSTLLCTACRVSITIEAKFCPHCGTAVRVEAVEAERRQLTVVFCDLVDSTRLVEQLDPEDFREVSGAFHAVCAAAISEIEGYVAQYSSDEVLAYFGYPVAHEDDACRALKASLAIVNGIETLNTRLRAERGLELSVRIGIDTGPVVVGAADRQWFEKLALGRTLHLAKRIQTFAQPGTVVISDDTFRIVLGYFDVEPLGAHRLKGLAEPVAMHRVLRVSGAQSRLDIGRRSGLTALIGRSQELANLEALWRSVADGTTPGHTVLVRGEAGIGKSRIVACLRESVNAGSYRTIECTCSPYSQNSPLYPIVSLVQRALGFNRDTPESDKWPALKRQLDVDGIGAADTAALLAQLLAVPLPEGSAPLGLSPQHQRERTLEALHAWLTSAARQGPVLFVVEDLHWADPTTLEFVKTVAMSSSRAPVLTVLTYRSEFEPPVHENGRISVLSLGRLGREDTLSMIVRVAKNKPLPEEVLRQLVDRTEGVPLFVEEITKSALELGILVERDDRFELAGPLPADLIPATVQGSLLARLDRLGSAKLIAQVAATIGREFRFDVLQAIVPVGETALREGLDRLSAAELIYQMEGVPDTTYLFKHALIQDAAYQSLLKKSRRDQHRRIAETLAARFADVVEQHPELIAQHFASGGDPGQAIAFWLRAGRRALARAANHEAVAHLSRALEQVDDLPPSRDRDEQELECNVVLTPALQMTQGWATRDVDHTFRRSVELVNLLGQTPHRPLVLINSAAFHVMRGQVSQALTLGAQVVEHAKAIELTPLQVMGEGICCVSQLYSGDIAAAIASGEAGLARASQASDAIVQMAGMAAESYLRCYLSEAWWMHGFPEKALRCSEDAVTVGRERKHGPSEAFAVGYQAMFFHLFRDSERILAVAEETFRLGQQHHSAFWDPVTTTYKGWALSAHGAHDEGIAMMRDGLSRYLASGHGLSQIHMLAALAEGLGNAGRWEEALATLDDAIAVVKHSGERYFEPEVHRLRGEFLRRLAKDDEGDARASALASAEASVRAGLLRAKQQQATSLELRAAMSLCLVQRDQGNAFEGVQVLVEVLGRFTEGFDTPDLRDARALVAEAGAGWSVARGPGTRTTPRLTRQCPPTGRSPGSVRRRGR